MKSKNIFSLERVLEAARHEANRPYVYGAVLGSLMTAAVAKAIDVFTSVSSSSGVARGGSKKSSSSKKKESTTRSTRAANSKTAVLRQRK